MNELIFKNLEYSSEMIEICKPLKIIGVHNFSYTNINNNGGRFFLTTSPDWHRLFFTELYKEAYHQNIINDNYNFKSSYDIWDKLNFYKDHKSNNIYDIAQQEFNRYHGLTISIAGNGFYEVFSFCTSKFNLEMNVLYEQNPYIFYNFVYYFKEKAAKLISLASANKISIPKVNIVASHKIITIDKNIEKFNKFTEVNKFNVSTIGSVDAIEPQTYFTKREVECIFWSAKGKSVKEIGIILGISANTVRTYIDKVRYKLNTPKLTTIIRFFQENHLIL